MAEAGRRHARAATRRWRSRTALRAAAAFEEDPAVKGLRERFGAEVDAASVKPANQKFRRMHMMKGGMGNLMRQAQQMQETMQKAQAELAELEVTGESGRGHGQGGAQRTPRGQEA